MNNIKLWWFFQKNKLNPQQFFNIIDYWFEWIFQKEIYEKIIKYGGF